LRLELNEPDIWKREFDPLERREAIDFGISVYGYSDWKNNGVRVFNLGINGVYMRKTKFFDTINGHIIFF
jgi:hypothetical protein